MGIVLRKGYVDTPDGQIHYGVEGSGKPVLLLHQNPRSMDEYTRFIPILAKTKKVFVMDTMGYGNSDKPPREYSIEDYAKSVIYLLEGLGIKRTSIVGHHTGAYIACEVAAAFPERVDKLILSGLRTSFIVTPEGDNEMQERVARARRISLNTSMPWNPEIKEDGSHLMFSWDYYRKGQGAPPEIAQRYVIDILKMSDKVMHSDALSKYRKEKLEKRLRLIKCPTLFIYGTKDLTGFPTEERLKAGKTVQRGKVKIIEGGTYFVIDLMPEKFAKLILDFLEPKKAEL